MKFHSYKNPEEYFEILDENDHSVVSFCASYDGATVEIREECDNHYCAVLTMDELDTLISMLKIMRDKTTNVPPEEILNEYDIIINRLLKKAATGSLTSEEKYELQKQINLKLQRSGVAQPL